MFAYDQRTGKLVVRVGSITTAVIGVGYAGVEAGLNAPELEHVRNVGPVPKGTYLVRETAHKRFASPAFELVPTRPTAERLRHIGRSGFWVHGDNGLGNQSASRGCIILGRRERAMVARYLKLGHTHLVVG